MKPVAHVAIFSLADSAPLRLRQSLLKQKFESQAVKNMAEADIQRKKHSELITVVCFGDEQDEGLALIKKLLAATPYHLLPLLVVGEEADTLKPELQKVFKVVGAVNSPTDPTQIVAEIGVLWDEYLKQQAERKAAAAAQLEKELNARAPQAGEGNSSKKARAFAEEFFERLKTLNLLGRTVGGSFFGKTSKVQNYISMLDTKGVGLAEACERILNGADSWVQGHSLRVAYISNCLLTALNVSSDQVLTTTRAALWHPVAFRSNRRIARGQYRGGKNSEYRQKVAKAVRESATKVSYEYQSPKESLMLGLFSRLIAQEEVTSGSHESIQAYALYAADLIDRACCTEGYFNPQKGYKLLREVKGGAFSDIDTSIAVAAVKFLSEAIVGAPPKMGMPAAILRDYRKRLAAGEIADTKPAPNEKRVPINKLSPGMKLSRPLCTFDGKEILESSLKLDEDLIMRVWQLTAIRPIESAIVTRDSAAQAE
jgi:hypothetical protein